MAESSELPSLQTELSSGPAVGDDQRNALAEPDSKADDAEKVPQSKEHASTEPPCDCEKSNGKLSGRNLVVCIDGTANQFSKKNTNVVELYSRLVKDKTQATFYNSGIGTYAPPSWKSLGHWKQVLGHKLDLAIAWRFERILLSAYRWLSENYEDGDKIFLFGFSRGAYQARAISAMIEKVGLIHKGNEDQIPFAYTLYAASGNPYDTTSDKVHERLKFNSGQCERFKETFSRGVRVHFVGAWDTVSSVGVVRDKSLPGTTDGMKHVCAFRHALALDEKRVKFLPEYAYGGNGPDGDDYQRIKEVWFAGSHSDIGGGSTDNTNLDHFGPALRWMCWEAGDYGLRFKEDKGKGQWENPGLTNSMTIPWKLLEAFPLRRLTYHTATGTTLIPHLCRPRRWRPGQTIHASLLVSPGLKTIEDGRYKPATLLDKGYTWDSLWEVREEIMEKDPYVFAVSFLEKMTPSMKDVEDLLLLISHPSGAGRRALQEVPKAIEKLFSMIHQLKADFNRGNDERGIYPRKIIDLIAAFPDSGDRYPPAQLTSWIHSSPLSTLCQEDHQKLQSFVQHFATAQIGSTYDDIPGWNPHIVFSHNSQMIAFSATFANQVGLIDVSRRKINVIGKCTSNSIAFSPDDRTIAFARDEYVQVWDIENGKTYKKLGPHTDNVTRIALSPDGKMLACGTNYALTVWQLESSSQYATHQHRYGISHSLTLSPSKLAFSIGSSVFIWNMVTSETIELKGHTDYISTVVFSQDGQYIASGSHDNTVRIWNVDKGQLVRTLEGHTNYVDSVAFSPDGKRVASGSWDKTIRVWNVTESGESAKPFEGHTSEVCSLSFSGDGTKLASCSHDGTIRIWDATLEGDWTEL